MQIRRLPSSERITQGSQGARPSISPTKVDSSQVRPQKGKERLFVFCGQPDMPMTYSEDGGKSWSPVKRLGKPCVMAFSSIIQLKNGDYLGLYHRGLNDQDRPPLTLWQSISFTVSHRHIRLAAKDK